MEIKNERKDFVFANKAESKQPQLAPVASGAVVLNYLQVVVVVCVTLWQGNKFPRSMGPPRIYVARHGQDEDNAAGILNGHRDRPLTSIGEAQARTVAKKIRGAGIPFDAVYSSPLLRSKRTAELIVEELDSTMEVTVLDDLIERDFGIMTGMPTKEIKRRCSPDILETDRITYFLSPEGAETFPDLIRRAKAVISFIEAKHTSGNLILVSHGDFGKMMYAAYYGLDWREVLIRFHFGNSEVLLLSENSDPGDTHVFEIPQHND